MTTWHNSEHLLWTLPGFDGLAHGPEGDRVSTMVADPNVRSYHTFAIGASIRAALWASATALGS